MNAAVKTVLPASTLDARRLDLLRQLTEGLPPAELYWIAAHSAGLAARRTTDGAAFDVDLAGEPLQKTSERLSIVYGSQTGNSRRVAENLAASAQAGGLSVRLLRTGAYPLRELAQERHLVVVISSQGDGDPPDDAVGFIEFIAGKRAPKLPQLKFAVLGLGDSSYPKYCVVSRDLDARLAELGASRITAVGEADADFESTAASWSAAVLEKAGKALQSKDSPASRSFAPGSTAQRSSTQDSPLHAVIAAPQHSREKPFLAPVLENQRIVSRDSDRDVRHIELSLEGSGLRYAPGDAIGVWPRNPPALVEQWLAALKLDGDHDVALDGKRLPLARWLGEQREITRLTRSFVAAQAAASGHADLQRVLQPEQQTAFAALLDSRQPIDLLREFPASWTADALVSALRPLTPRLYSIASSPDAVGPDEVHLTVAVVDYTAGGHAHVGAASSFLASAGDDARVPLFVESNERFRLPVDNSRDVIMIGPGTGIAPFRAFVQERQATAASGRHWLFFGNRHFSQDFLYQAEWQQALRSGALDRLELAFSRDQSQKIYVQDRLREHGRELYAWLNDGAHLYVCGDSRHMAKDVHAALVEVVVAHGRKSPEDAQAWLSELLQQGRYARDVY